MSSLRIVLLATVCLTLSACDQYMAGRYLVRRDTATSSSGDSIASNSAVQIPDPWPRGSHDTNIAFDGEKISRAVNRYRKDKEYLPPNWIGASSSSASEGYGTSQGAGAAPPGAGAGADTGASQGAGAAPGAGAGPGY